MNGRNRIPNRLQHELIRTVLFRAEPGPTHLPPLAELGRLHEAPIASVRQALEPLVAHGLVELRGRGGPWLPPLPLRRGIETIALELEVARNGAERLRPLTSWLRLEHELTVDAFRRCCRARRTGRERVAHALDQVIVTVFMQGPSEALALYRWRAITAAVTASNSEPLRLLANSLGRSLDRVLPFMARALDPQALGEELVELQEHVLERDAEAAATVADLATLRLHARVLEQSGDDASVQRVRPMRRAVTLARALRAG